MGNLVSDLDISVGFRAEVAGVIMWGNNVRLMIVLDREPFRFSVTVYVFEGARVGEQVIASNGIVYWPPGYSPQRVEKQSPASAPTILQSSEPRCQRCRSILLILDPVRLGWRCMNCGNYEESANTLSEYYTNQY